MMKVMPGGMRLPSAPPAASEPSTIRWLYAELSKYGSATEPMVAAVATEEPEIAENTAQETILVCSNPPGSRFSQTFSARYSLSDSPARSRISPISRKSGTATSTKFDDGPHKVCPAKAHQGRSE